MKLPLSWLNEFVDVSDIPPAELAERLTRSGLQVVLTCEVIEGTHLHKTTVTDGKETLQIVCGAPNCRAGLKTALAKIGAVVPDGGFKIKKGKLRGVESFGMLCSSKPAATTPASWSCRPRRPWARSCATWWAARSPRRSLTSK